MMDDNAAQTNSVSDPYKELSDILKSGVTVEKIVKTSDNSVVVGSRFTNKFVRGYVEKLRKLGKYTDTQILNLVLSLDEKVEAKKVTQETLNKLKDKNK